MSVSTWFVRKQKLSRYLIYRLDGYINKDIRTIITMARSAKIKIFESVFLRTIGFVQIMVRLSWTRSFYPPWLSNSEYLNNLHKSLTSVLWTLYPKFALKTTGTNLKFRFYFADFFKITQVWKWQFSFPPVYESFCGYVSILTNVWCVKLI